LKLHVCPPLAEKNQIETEAQARGFQVVSLDDAGQVGVDIVWYNNAHFPTDPPRRGSSPLLEKIDRWPRDLRRATIEIL
jgi:hypothetical protein